MRTMLIAAATALTLGASPALAQAPANPTGDPANKPLMTAPRPGDQPTTDQVSPTPGISGEAPSRELTGQGNTGVPGSVPQARDGTPNAWPLLACNCAPRPHPAADKTALHHRDVKLARPLLCLFQNGSRSRHHTNSIPTQLC